MQTEKKAFKVVYKLVLDGVITEKEAFSLVEGIFEKEMVQIPIPVPTPVSDEENPVDEVPKDKEEVTVRGFGRE